MGGGGVFEGAGDTTMHTMVYKGPQKTTTKTKNFSVIHDIFTRNCVIYFMWKTLFLRYAQTGNETKCCYECASLSFIWGHSFSAHKIFQKSNISSSFLENFA